jgi:hypothetical protein
MPDSRVLMCGLVAALLAACAAATSAVAVGIVVRILAGAHTPDPDLPADARQAGTVPDTGAGPSGNITFRIVADTRDHGPLSVLMTGRVSVVEVDWWDRALFKADAAVDAYVRRLLGASSGSTTTFVPWAQRLPVPSLTAITEERDGHRGRLRVWYQWPSVYTAYQDGDGTWWFSHWLGRDDVRLPP